MNMSYCRFQNTYPDFQDCLENLRTLDPLDHSYNTMEERWARRNLIMAAAEMLAELGIEDVCDTHALMRCIEELNQEPIEHNEIEGGGPE